MRACGYDPIVPSVIEKKDLQKGQMTTVTSGPLAEAGKFAEIVEVPRGRPLSNGDFDVKVTLKEAADLFRQGGAVRPPLNPDADDHHGHTLDIPLSMLSKLGYAYDPLCLNDNGAGILKANADNERLQVCLHCNGMCGVCGVICGIYVV